MLEQSIQMGLEKQVRQCVKCMHQARYKCQRCLDMYCSSDCQMSDWSHHKTVCFPLPNLVPLEWCPVIPVPRHLFVSATPTKSVPLPIRSLQSAAFIEEESPSKVPVTMTMPCARTVPATAVTAPKMELISGITNLKVTSPLRRPNSELVEDTQKMTATKDKISAQNPFTACSAVNNDSYPGLQQNAKVVANAQVSVAPNAHTVADKPLAVPTASAVQTVNRRVNLSMLSKITAPTKTPQPSPVTSPSSSKSLASWTRPFPVEEGKFIKVTVQYVCPSTLNCSCWVMLAELENECNKLLKGIHRGVGVASPSCTNAEIQLNQLYAVQFEEVFYRAVCIEPVNPLNKAKFRLVDYGNEFYAKLNDIKKPIPLMINLQAFAFPIRFNNAKPELCIGNELSIMVLSEADSDGVYTVVEEKAESDQKTATAAPTAEAIGASASINSTAITTETEIFTLSSIEIIPIPENVKTKLYLWDLSDIDEGLIVAGILDQDKIDYIEQSMSAQMGAYCKSLTVKEYKPFVGELCLAVFDIDSNWYRAVCVDNQDIEAIQLLFLDYGNITYANTKRIRPISKQFLCATLANTCVVAGVPSEISPEKVRKLLLANPVFEIESANRVDQSAYVIRIVGLH